MNSWRDFPCKLSGRRYANQQHRRIWIQHHGLIPLGMYICHHCDDARCWEIQHLFLATPKQNTADAINKGRFRFHPENLTPGLPQRGEQHGNSKLKTVDVLTIRATPSVYGSGRRLARHFGITPEMISLIRHRKVWRHV